jgi:hypothetical protein
MAKFSRPFSVAKRLAYTIKNVHVDTQKIREKLLESLLDIFEDAVKLAKGKVSVDKQELTLKQRQAWARVAAYTAQIIESVTKGFDEQKINRDLEELERLIREARAKAKNAGAGKGAAGAS